MVIVSVPLYVNFSLPLFWVSRFYGIVIVRKEGDLLMFSDLKVIFKIQLFPMNTLLLLNESLLMRDVVGNKYQGN